MAKHFEFWHPRVFESPYYLYLVVGAWLRGLSIKSLAKANYALDHGEIGIGSKFKTQMAFNQARFLPTELLRRCESGGEASAGDALWRRSRLPPASQVGYWQCW